MAEKRKNPRYSSINIDGVKYKTLLTEKFKNREKYKDKDPNRITAFIPGTIVEVFVSKGKKVNEGDVLLILEAMKMRNVVVAPHDGLITKLLVKENDNVSKGQLMVEVS